MRLEEYSDRIHAYRLKKVDEEHIMHQQAWINHKVTATTEKGKPVYKNFGEFYDYEANLKEVENPRLGKITNKQKSMAKIAAEINSGRR